MPKTRLISTVVSTIAILGVSMTMAQKPSPEAGPRPLDPGVTAVRVLLGIGDETPQDWSGRVTVDKGEVVAVEGVRFREGDAVTGRDAWKARSCLVRKAATKKAAAKAARRAAAKAARKAAAARPTSTNTVGASVFPNAVVVTIKDAAGATLSVETANGRFQASLDRLADGSPLTLLDGRVAVQRVFPHAPLIEAPRQQDFPAAAADGKDGAWVAYVEHTPRGPDLLPSLNQRPRDFSAYRPGGGGDHVRLIRFRGGQAGDPIDITDPGRDVWRPAVAGAGDGSIVVAWTEKRGDDWDIFARRFDGASGAFQQESRLTDRPGSDAEPVLATAADGTVWMAWQSWSNGQSDIMLAPIDASGKLGSPPVNVNETTANEWAPSIAAGTGGRVHVAFDTYRSGNYDVVLRTRERDGKLAPPINVAASSAYEARPSLAADPKGRVWVAYEERTANWGKDAVNLVDGEGSSLDRAARVVVACVDGGRVLRAPDPVDSAPQPLRRLNSFPRLAIDRAGRPWLAFRHRQEAIWGSNAVMVVGAVWIEYATTLSGSAWSSPRPLTRSDGTLDGRPSLVQPEGGPMLAFYATDGRLRREVERSGVE